ncbi:TPA: hypothetical protein ACMDP1_002221 [Vibrio cholerae]
MIHVSCNVISHIATGRLVGVLKLSLTAITGINTSDFEVGFSHLFSP